MLKSWWKQFHLEIFRHTSPTHTDTRDEPIHIMTDDDDDVGDDVPPFAR